MSIPNPNRDRDWVNSYPDMTPIEKASNFPQFFTELRFDMFRHISNLTLPFNSPITVIAGNNKSGKTTVLMAIACSHFNFQRRNINNGDLERNTWGDIMKFTSNDDQATWTYHVKFRQGTVETSRQGQRKHNTKKWNGVAKKEGQIGAPRGNNQAGRQVTLIDLERIVPARHLPAKVYKKAKNTVPTNINQQIQEYISYIFEEQYQLREVCSSADTVIYNFSTTHSYSSYNSASGEDALSRLLRDIVDAPRYSLVLIEEIEVGLHPKMQRRLMDVLYHEAKEHSKQFIVTTHSSTILSSVEASSRLFIDNSGGVFKSIPSISVNSALSRMDAIGYPLVNFYVEDDLSKKIVAKAISSITAAERGFNHLVHVIISGSANDTYNNFVVSKDTYQQKKIKCGYACILDGDMRRKMKNGQPAYPPDALLFFHLGNEAPERILVRKYLVSHQDINLQYHVDDSNCHCLFHKMEELGICQSQDDAFERCWTELLQTAEGQQYFQDLKIFIKDVCMHFAPDL